MSQTPIKNVISLSGGKDSTALLLEAVRRGVEFEAVFADTGHENPITYEYIGYLSMMLNVRIRWVKADFSEQIARKRNYVATRWLSFGVRSDIIHRALAVLHPTGVPFLDLCLWKGRFPSTSRRFCSSELKHEPIFFQVLDPLLGAGHKVFSWQGVRADESLARSRLASLEPVGGGLYNYRPILRWDVQTVFETHRHFGIEPNPLYKMGAARVGCSPCIHARKLEIREMARRFPEEIKRIVEWERVVALASKRGKSSFFSVDKTPGAHKKNFNIPVPGIKKVVIWSNTSKGGKVLEEELEELPMCSSIYGLCE